MAQLSTLLDRIFDEFPAVPEAMALRALSDSVKEFCSRSHAWQEVLPAITLRVGVSAYELYPDTGTQIAALKDVRLDGRKIYPVAAELPHLRHQSPGPSAPAQYTRPRANTIELTAPPVSAARLAVKAALTLATGSIDVDVPDVLMDEYGEHLANGAKMRLVRQASQPWYAPDSVVAYAGPFYSAVNEAKSRVMTSMGEAEMRVEMRKW